MSMAARTPCNAPTTDLGDLISLFYDEFLALYRDEELASMTTAAIINELIAMRDPNESDNVLEFKRDN